MLTTKLAPIPLVSPMSTHISPGWVPRDDRTDHTVDHCRRNQRYPWTLLLVKCGNVGSGHIVAHKYDETNLCRGARSWITFYFRVAKLKPGQTYANLTGWRWCFSKVYLLMSCHKGSSIEPANVTYFIHPLPPCYRDELAAQYGLTFSPM